MADVIYNSFKKKIMDGSIDLDTDTIKVALVTSSYTPDQDAHDFFDDVTNEVTGTGYTAGGATLANKTVTADNTDNEGVFDADDVSWTTSTITARGAVIYKSTGTASTSPIIAYIDFGADKTSTAGTFQITWAAEGILNLN
ncbi:MAG TPA: hypothetical protein VF679_11875 [Pedobacter sp.]